MVSLRPLLLLALLSSLLAMPLGAGAETQGAEAPVDLRIEQLVVDPDGTTRMTVAVTGLPEGDSVSLENLEVVENGEPVEGLTLTGAEAVDSEAVVPGVVVVMDVSGSTQGAPLDAAKAAAVQLLAEVTDSGARVGAVSFGETTKTLAQLSPDPGVAIQAVAGLQAGGGTALYDGVSRAARLLAGHDGPRDVVVFSDGEDTTSSSGLDDVRALLAQTSVRVTSVLLQTEEVAEAPLQAMAAVNSGRFVPVEAAGDLGSAFEAVVGDLTNRLDVTWTVDPVVNPPRSLNVVATYSTEAGVATDGEQVDSPRLALLSPPREVDPAAPIAPALAGASGRVVAAVSTGLALLILLLLVLVSGGIRRRRDELDERLAAYQTGAVGDRGREDRVSLSDRASSAFDIIPRPTNLDSRISRAIERADWPMRVSEFLLLSIAVAVLGFLIGAVVVASGLAAFLGVLLGLSAPWIALTVAISRRRSAFAEQLPTVLQVIAGALRAGHALSTALDGAVDEVDEPARSELRRASVEARLGRPLDRALLGVARRMDSEDLQWVIGAIEVQREVGGNLAEILSNVADTLRDRASIHRHVKSLTAEGRLSAVFIASMPFGMFVLLNIINPDYMQLLYETMLGRLMLVAGFVLLLLGVLVLRRIVRPRY